MTVEGDAPSHVRLDGKHAHPHAQRSPRYHPPSPGNTWHRAACVALCLIAFSTIALGAGKPVLRVAYAGSMGTVMDGALGPVFATAHDVSYQGIGQGSYALARLLAAHEQQADVFIAITPGPIEVLKRAGLVRSAVPIASTRMVVIYSPHSRFAADFRAAADGRGKWYEVLERPGLRLGRTDPSVDPQGGNALLTLQLAARYYHEPRLLQRIAGPLQNPRQIFAEPSLMARLQAGQIDAAIGYQSAARSYHLPTIALPPQIDLADPSMQAAWYAKARLTLADGKVLTAQPLVFYAAVPADAPYPAVGREFVSFLTSDRAQRSLRTYGYGAPHGGDL